MRTFYIYKMKEQVRDKSGFTLIELLISSSILMMIIAMSMRIFFNVSRLNTYIELTNTLHFETRYALERVVREVQTSTIDYPEYYNYYVLNGSGTEFVGDNLGSNYSVYGARFLNPGEDANNLGTQAINTGKLPASAPVTSTSPDGLGTWCQYGVNSLGDPKVQRIEDPLCDGYPSLEATEDFATGTNPYTSTVFTLPTQASAICDSTSEMFAFSKRDCSFTSPTLAHEVDMLFLMSSDGSEKTIITTEPWSQNSVGAGNVVSLLKMSGTDTDNDGVRETWVCSDGFICLGPSLTKPVIDTVSKSIQDINRLKNTGNMFTEFAPISPFHLNITDLRFYLAPIEDPLKAYDEFPEQIQPYVTIVMTAEIIDPRVSQLPISQRSITLQTTVSTQFYGEINSYLSD